MHHYSVEQLMYIHRPLFYIVLFFGSGILVGSCFRFPFKSLMLLNIMALLLGLCFFKRVRLSSVCILIGVFFLGCISFSNHQKVSKEHINRFGRYYVGKTVGVRGIIISDVTQKKSFYGMKKSFSLKVTKFKTKWGWREKRGMLLVNMFSDVAIEYGDDLLLEGKLHYPFEYSKDSKFSYSKYLSRAGIKFILSLKKDSTIKILKKEQGSYFRRVSLRVRHRFKGVLHQYLSSQEAGLMQAMLLGDRSQIPKHIRELFAQTGVAHILAISGLHIGIVTGVIFLFLKLIPIPRKLQITLTIIFLIAYVFLTGGRPSIIRATIMAVILLLGLILEKETDSINSLSLAALIILMVNPLNLFDVGFQMSFFSVFSILTYYPKLSSKLYKHVNLKGSKSMRWLIDSALVSFAAWIGVGGLIAYYFQIITPISILANIVIIPMISLIVALGMGLIFFGLLFSPVAFCFAQCLKLLLNTMALNAYFFSKVPGAYFYLKSVSVWYIITYYIIVVVLIRFIQEIHLRLTK